MDILEEARLAALFQRAVKKSEGAFSAKQALELATIGGARALRIDDRVGSLEVGKDADLAAFSLASARVTPVGDVIAAILFAVAGTPAHFVAVKGRPLLADREPLSVDPALRARVAAAGDSLAAWDRAATWVSATVGSVS
jgi:5-methylthioadenosine/S-adenosylhomocysteine deaminase